MNVLTAVNRIINGLGDPSVLALGSTGTWPSKTFNATDEGQAESYLEQESKRIQSEGGTGDAWWIAELHEFQIRAPMYRFHYTSTDPTTLVYGETFTQATSGATVQFNLLDAANNYVYAGVISGTVDTTNNYSIVSATSAVTLVIDAVVAQTASTVALPSTWLKVRSSEREFKQVGARGTTLYEIRDLDDSTNPPVGTFDEDIFVDAVEYLEFSTLPETLAYFIMKTAAAEFNFFKKRSMEDYQKLAGEAGLAKCKALAEDGNARRANVLGTAEAYRMRGGRARIRVPGNGVMSGWFNIGG